MRRRRDAFVLSDEHKRCTAQEQAHDGRSQYCQGPATFIMVEERLGEMSNPSILATHKRVNATALCRKLVVCMRRHPERSPYLVLSFVASLAVLMKRAARTEAPPPMNIDAELNQTAQIGSHGRSEKTKIHHTWPTATPNRAKTVTRFRPTLQQDV